MGFWHWTFVAVLELSNQALGSPRYGLENLPNLICQPRDCHWTSMTHQLPVPNTMTQPRMPLHAVLEHVPFAIKRELTRDNTRGIKESGTNYAWICDPEKMGGSSYCSVLVSFETYGCSSSFTSLGIGILWYGMSYLCCSQAHLGRQWPAGLWERLSEDIRVCVISHRFKGTQELTITRFCDTESLKQTSATVAPSATRRSLDKHRATLCGAKHQHQKCSPGDCCAKNGFCVRPDCSL